MPMDSARTAERVQQGKSYTVSRKQSDNKRLKQSMIHVSPTSHSGPDRGHPCLRAGVRRFRVHDLPHHAPGRAVASPWQNPPATGSQRGASAGGNGHPSSAGLGYHLVPWSCQRSVLLSLHGDGCVETGAFLASRSMNGNVVSWRVISLIGSAVMRESARRQLPSCTLTMALPCVHTLWQQTYEEARQRHPLRWKPAAS